MQPNTRPRANSGGRDSLARPLLPHPNLLRQRPLRARNARHARIGFDGHPQRPGRGFEHRFADVVVVAAVVEHTCKFNRPLAATACQKSSTSSLSKSPILGDANGDLKHQEVAAAQVEGRGDQRFFHRQREVAVAADAGFVAQRLLAVPGRGRCRRPRPCGADRRANRRRPRPTRSNGRVLGQQRQHVIEEADAGGDLRLARAVEIQFQSISFPPFGG